MKRKHGASMSSSSEPRPTAAPAATVGPARSMMPSPHAGVHAQAARRPVVHAESQRALEVLLLQAAQAAVASGALPPHDWTAGEGGGPPFLVAPIVSMRAATHYSSGALKAAHAYNVRHHPVRLAVETAAAAAARKPHKAKKQRAAAAVEAVDAPNAADAGAAPAPAAPPAADSTDPSFPYADAQHWAECVAASLRPLLAALPAEHRLAGRVLVDVPPAAASVRGGGFIDFTIATEATKAAAATPTTASAASAAASRAAASSDSAAAASSAASASVPADLAVATSFTLHSIGTISSVFKLKYGTPRQGTIAPAARGSFTLHPSIPEASLDGIEEYSHIWIVFIFHQNNNKAFHPKIAPPRAGGLKLGVFSTRSPHRVNPLGLSLVRLERREGRTLHLSSLDLIQGTPVIDIKPFHPADGVPLSDVCLPQWMRDQAEVKPPFAVTLDPLAETQLAALVAAQQLEFYSTAAEVRAAVCESVSHDPRPRYVRARASAEEVYGFRLDSMNVLYSVDDATQSVRVRELQHVDVAALRREQAEEARRREAGEADTALEAAGEVDGAQAAAAPARAAAATVHGQSEEDAITKRFLQQRAKRNTPAAAPAAAGEPVAAAAAAAHANAADGATSSNP